MGPGDDVFSAFGHGALCVLGGDLPTGACYNYGTADFNNPVDLGWTFLRGRARFWVARTPLSHMLANYVEEDRSVWRQRLPLTPEAAARLAAALEDDIRPENRYYLYHHYKDNCVTRLRDHIDEATGGALSGDKSLTFDVTYRELTRRGFLGDPLMLAVTELALGRLADEPTTAWQAMFLPAILRAEVSRVFGVEARAGLPAQGPTLPSGSPHMGQALFWGAALALAFLLALAGATGWGWSWRPGARGHRPRARRARHPR